MDFTLTKYRQLLLSLKQAGFVSVLRFSNDTSQHQLLLRHDVDLNPQNSLRTAQLEAELGMKAIYYFRIVPESYDESIIQQISSLGHEIGYHYECLTTSEGNIEAAYLDFCNNLHGFNNLLTNISDSLGGGGQRFVSSICMHGSPRSPFDSRDIWKVHTYNDLGINYEPYFDTDFSRTLYLTDTGRRWDGYNVSVRDKIPSYQDQWIAQGLTFHSTSDIIDSMNNPSSPLSQFIIHNRRILLTTHPQRWNPFGFSWLKEFILQKIKNLIKAFLVKFRP